MGFDLNDLNFDEIGTWPVLMKSIAIALVCVFVIFAIFWFDTRSQLNQLHVKEKRELALKEEFETKQQQAANLNTYREQLQTIEKSLGRLINQLPAKTEVPELLENISKTGIATGLHFRLFKPESEHQHEFISELPIRISVIGNFHQLGQFVSQIVALSRIVTLHNFKIKKYEAKKRTASEKKKIDLSPDNLLLQMDITAKTYRYNV